MDQRLPVLCWVDCARRYFISTSASVRPGNVSERKRWLQGPKGPERVTVIVPQPQVFETYCSTAAVIDQHIRCREDDLGLERKVQVKD